MVKFNFNDSNTFGGVGKVGGKSAAASRPSFSPSDVRSFFSRYLAEMICAAAVIFTGLGVWQFVNFQMQKVNALASDTQLLLDKEDPSLRLKKIVDEGASVFAQVPVSLPEKKFISQVTALANKHNITITSIAPPESRDGGFFYRAALQMTCVVDSFQDALLFLNDIERSEYALKVESWKVRPMERADRPARDSNMWGGNSSGPGFSGAVAGPKLEIAVVVSSIEILDNEKN